MNRLHLSIFFSALERYGSFFFLLISTAILSRLLTPEEFGLYAVISALTSITGIGFQEFGGANYLIQKKSLSEQNIRTAFTTILCTSILLAFVFFESRHVVAWFYSQPGLRVGIAIAALNLLLSPFAVTVSALLRREMEFKTLARCGLAGGFVTAVTSIALAALGYSFLAPLWGSVVGNATTVAMLLAHRPILRIFWPSIAGYREVIGFGAYSSILILINVVHDFAPQLILGRVLDFTAVGIYNRAAGTAQLFDRLVVQVLNPVVMPAMAVKARDGSDLRRIYLEAIELLAVLQWPFLIFVAMMAWPIVWIWLGSTWIEVVPLLRLLCVASLSLFAACLTFPTLVAVGRVRDALIASLISLPPSLFAIYIASLFGVTAVAASALLTLPFQAAVAIYFISRHLAFGVADLFHASLKSAIVTACTVAGLLLALAITQFSDAHAIFELIVASICASVGWWLGLIVVKHPLLVQIRSAASGVPFVARALPFLGRENQLRSDRNSR
jgi:O-antigen/teichoic acid export membrane protein